MGSDNEVRIRARHPATPSAIVAALRQHSPDLRGAEVVAYREVAGRVASQSLVQLADGEVAGIPVDGPVVILAGWMAAGAGRAEYFAWAETREQAADAYVALVDWGGGEPVLSAVETWRQAYTVDRSGQLVPLTLDFAAVRAEVQFLERHGRSW